MNNSELSIGQKVFIYDGKVKPFEGVISSRSQEVKSIYYIQLDKEEDKKLYTRFHLYAIPDELEYLHDKILEDIEYLNRTEKEFKRVKDLILENN